MAVVKELQRGRCRKDGSRWSWSQYQATMWVEHKLLASQRYEATEKFLQGVGTPGQQVSLAQNIESRSSGWLFYCRKTRYVIIVDGGEASKLGLPGLVGR
jgi:hypothetical protein